MPPPWQGLTQLLAVYDGADNLILRLEYADSRLPVSLTRSGQRYYLLYDQVGSLRAVTDALGNLIKTVDYDAFGYILADTNPAFTIPFGFAGGLHDRDTGLVRFGYRDYDPETGRWTAKDPILFDGGDTDLYGYVLNNPVNLIDPTGEFYLQAAAPIAGYMAIMDGPLPFGDILAAGLMTGAATLDLYNLLESLPQVKQNQGSTDTECGKHSDEKQALVEMAKQDKKKGGISADDMSTYKELNKQLEDPFPENTVRGPEIHPDRNINIWHGHVGPVRHIPIR
ncbi:MAG: RHS repeat domain-containing protein [Thermodesulfobacteriota bacterium]